MNDFLTYYVLGSLKKWKFKKEFKKEIPYGISKNYYIITDIRRTQKAKKRF